MSETDWKLPGCVPFWPLVLNMNGFKDDDEYNRVAFLTVLTVSQYEEKNSTYKFGNDYFALFWTYKKGYL